MQKDEEEGYSDAYLAKEIFGMSLEGFEYYREEIIRGLVMDSNPFWHQLSSTIMSANTNQAIKLINTFRRECENYAWLYRIQVAADKEKDAILASMSS